MLLFLAAGALFCNFCQDNGSGTLLLVHQERENAEWAELLERSEELLSTEGKVQRAPLAILQEMRPTAGSLPVLELYAATRQRGASTGWLVQFDPPTEVTTFEAVDVVHGLHAIWGSKEREGGKELLEEERELLEAALAHAREALHEQRARLADPSPYREEPVWSGAEDPPHPGFRWRYDGLPVVTFVFAGSHAEQAGLQAGDEIVAVNGQIVRGPADFGRSVGPLQAGDRLALTVRRGEERHELAAQVESSRDLIPRFEASALGHSLGELLGDALPESWKAAQGKVLCIPVFSPRFPGSWESFVELRWLAEHAAPEDLVIQGLSRDTEAADLQHFLEEARPGWSALPDPAGSLADALRVPETPAVLWVDREGVLRFRWARGADLQRAFRTLRDLR